MQSRDVVGKRIARVVQRRVRMGDGRPSIVIVESLVLEDGTVLSTHAEESDWEPMGTLLVFKPAQKGAQ